MSFSLLGSKVKIGFYSTSKNVITDLNSIQKAHTHICSSRWSSMSFARVMGGVAMVGGVVFCRIMPGVAHTCKNFQVKFLNNLIKNLIICLESCRF